ncbi:MAG: hypothetical protein PXY39_12900 [archaeon]|nr:hypothetical protein [archaeon]
MRNRSRSTVVKVAVVPFLFLVVLIVAYLPYFLIQNNPFWSIVQSGLFAWDDFLGLGPLVGDSIALFGMFLITGFLLVFAVMSFRKDLLPQGDKSKN